MADVFKQIVKSVANTDGERMLCLYVNYDTSAGGNLQLQARQLEADRLSPWWLSRFRVIPQNSSVGCRRLLSSKSPADAVGLNATNTRFK